MPDRPNALRHVFTAWFTLLRVDCLMKYRGFALIQQVVKDEPVRLQRSGSEDEYTLSSAIDLACVLYFKQVHCLQRSAALAVLLKSSGINAEMVIGAQLFPFLSHAWVEVQGRVINDKPYVRQMFHELDRC